MTNDTGFDAVVRELQLARTETHEGFAAVVSALQGLGIKVENLERSNARELRVIGNQLNTVNERLASLDEKVDDVREHVMRVESRRV